MSIVRRSPADPKDKLVRISEEEALDLQWKTIYEWEPKSEVWPFTVGLSGLGLCAALTSLYVVGFYRRSLKLKQYARISMNLSVACTPAVLVPMLHHKIVSGPILLQSACPVCIQLRAMLIQCCGGVLFPLILAPITGFMYSTLFVTYPLPLLTVKNMPKLYSIWRNMTMPLGRKLPYLLAVNAFAAAFVTEFEARSFFTMQEKLILTSKKKK